jgi:hypothetical protein
LCVFHCHDRTPEQSNLREKGFVLVFMVSEGSLHHNGECIGSRAAHITAARKQRERMSAQDGSLLFPLFSIQAPNLWNGATTYIQGGSFPWLILSGSILTDILKRCALLISNLPLNPIKLKIKFNHHIHYVIYMKINISYTKYIYYIILFVFCINIYIVYI